jgi:hypothetical protein
MVSDLDKIQDFENFSEKELNQLIDEEIKRRSGADAV